MGTVIVIAIILIVVFVLVSKGKENQQLEEYVAPLIAKQAAGYSCLNCSFVEDYGKDHDGIQSLNSRREALEMCSFQYGMYLTKKHGVCPKHPNSTKTNTNQWWNA